MLAKTGMKWVVIGAVTAGLVAWALYGPASRFLSIDSCLDRGGAWNYAEDHCVFAEASRVGIE